MNSPLRSRRATRGLGLASLFLILVAAPAAWAQEPVQIGMTVEDRSEGSVELVEKNGQLPLSLEDAIAVALDRNLALSIQRHLRSETLLRIREAIGIYDITLSGSVQESSDAADITSTLVETGGAPLRRENRNLQASLARLFPTGGNLSMTFTSNRGADNNRANFVNPQFNQNFDLRFTQPLLRGFGKRQTEQAVIVARISSHINRENFDLEVQRIVAEVAQGYWNLVEAYEQLRVANESLSLAQELHKKNEIQVQVGTMAPLETVRSDARVARSKSDIIRFRADVEDRADALRRLLNLDQGPLWNVPIQPMTQAEVPTEPVDIDAVIEAGLANRSEIRRKRLEIETATHEAKLAKQNLRPQLDLDATYGFNGTGGPAPNPDGTINPGGFSDALNQITGRDLEGWAVSLNFSYPLRNQAAKARYAAADLAVDRNYVELRDLEQDVITNIRRLARAVDTAAEQIDASRAASNLEQKNLEAEEKRYENGLSTSFEVLQIQEQLTQARRDDVAAVVGYRQALIALYQATGELLDNVGVELVEEGPVEEMEKE